MANLKYKFIYNGCTYRGEILDVENIPTALTDTENDKKLTAIYNEFENIGMEKAADILASAIFEYCWLVMDKTGVFIQVNGINHIRYIGFDVKSDECYDFDPINAHSYRGAENAKEIEIAEQTALNFYNKRKGERRGAFGTKQVTRELLTYNSSIGYNKPEYLFDGLED